MDLADDPHNQSAGQCKEEEVQPGYPIKRFEPRRHPKRREDERQERRGDPRTRSAPERSQDDRRKKSQKGNRGPDKTEKERTDEGRGQGGGEPD